jgi:nicotinate-nucleotide--dimethylbenzimidazole phosphoribosyltransferase
LLTKPPGSLGRLESLVVQYARIHGTATPPIARKAMVVFCGDHGVAEEGVSPYPREVTTQMVKNFLRGGAAINVLCRKIGIETTIVDSGVDADPEPGALTVKIARGTQNFLKGPAMTIPQVEQALESGSQLASEVRNKADVTGVGEMGIGNSTSASALLCAYCGVAALDAVGRGAGLDDRGVRHKADVVARAVQLHRDSLDDPVQALAALGGFEIAMMAGFLLGAASRRLPVVVDGFISGAAALAARAIQPRVVDYLIFSHRSAERAHGLMLQCLGVPPLLELQMRLGEGTGAALAIELLENALALYTGMATFAEAQVSGQPD